MIDAPHRLPEELNLWSNRPEQAPQGFGWTCGFQASDARLFTRSLREVWSTVARWGRFCDASAKSWPTHAQTLEALPPWFAGTLANDTFGRWLGDVHDREWIVWSVAAQGSHIKVDLVSDALPLSSWPLRHVAEALGATTLTDDRWTPRLGAPG